MTVKSSNINSPLKPGMRISFLTLVKINIYVNLKGKGKSVSTGVDFDAHIAQQSLSGRVNQTWFAFFKK